MVVFGRHEHEGVEGRDLGGPVLGVLLAVLALRRRDGFVQQRQVEILEVDEFVLRVGARAGDVGNPPRDGFAVAARPVLPRMMAILTIVMLLWSGSIRTPVWAVTGR